MSSDRRPGRGKMRRMNDDHRPFDRIMNGELNRAGFDARRPDPRVAWAAFKAFAVQPLPDVRTVTVGFTCDHDDSRDRTVWMRFARLLEDPDTGNGHDCGCGFSRDVPADLVGIAARDWWWAEHGSLADWFARVEAMPAFVRCVAAADWRWEGFSL